MKGNEDPDAVTLARLKEFLAEEAMLEEGLTFTALPSPAEIAAALANKEGED